jgi:hypothetical protein
MLPCGLPTTVALIDFSLAFRSVRLSIKSQSNALTGVGVLEHQSSRDLLTLRRFLSKPAFENDVLFPCRHSCLGQTNERLRHENPDARRPSG